MDKNTITGIILIFLIFIGFSVYNGNRLNKSYEKTIARADSLYEKGDMENARAEYINALRFKPNKPEAIAKVNEINQKMVLVPVQKSTDSLEVKQVKEEPVNKVSGVSKIDSSQYGAFVGAAIGDTGLITLENNKIRTENIP